jgi:hypothetical protein
MLLSYSNRIKRNWLWLPILCMVCACVSNPYKSTNKIYRQQATAFAKQLRGFPAMDSLQPPAYAAGTTNFNLRKPNLLSSTIPRKTAASKR